MGLLPLIREGNTSLQVDHGGVIGMEICRNKGAAEVKMEKTKARALYQHTFGLNITLAWNRDRMAIISCLCSGTGGECPGPRWGELGLDDGPAGLYSQCLVHR